MIFIPTHNPNKNLIRLIKKLIKKKIRRSLIFIINDGSNKGLHIFKFLRKNRINIVNIKNKKGKGNAIKVSLKIAFKKKLSFAIFADADGQHSDQDILKLFHHGNSKRFDKNKVIVTQRKFSNQMPFFSKFGNKVSSKLINILFKMDLIDTQCGLRLIPIKFFKQFTYFKNNDFDFEMICLIEAIKQDSLNSKIFIRSIYKKDRISYFNKVLDSYKIIKQIILRKIYDI